ncbi:Protein of unknown function, partial [Gryllus bimaculatus]
PFALRQGSEGRVEEDPRQLPRRPQAAEGPSQRADGHPDRAVQVLQPAELPHPVHVEPEHRRAGRGHQARDEPERRRGRRRGRRR